jgi:GINS complex subunit 2
MKGSLSENELEFFAEFEYIEILPKFSMEEIDLVEGTVGPFESNVLVKVPLWMGCTLRKKGVCKIIQPKWLTVEKLKEILQEEKLEQRQQDFSSLPFYFLEIGLILLKYSNLNGSDFEKSENIKSKKNLNLTQKCCWKTLQQ